MDFEEWQSPGPDEHSEVEDEIGWGETPSVADAQASFHDQILRDSWPIRMPITFEIFAEADSPEIHTLEPGQRRRHPDSHILTLELEFDRAKVRDLVLERIRSLRASRESSLVDIILLARVDRRCFLETGAAHFADLFWPIRPPARGCATSSWKCSTTREPATLSAGSPRR